MTYFEASYTSQIFYGFNNSSKLVNDMKPYIPILSQGIDRMKDIPECSLQQIISIHFEY